MPTTDTNIYLQPFYIWDSVPYPRPEEDVNVGIPMDSIFKTYDPQDVVVRESMLVPSTLEPEHDSLTPRVDTTPSAWLFVLIIALIALLYAYFRNRSIQTRTLLTSLIDRRAMERMMRDKNLTTMRFLPICFFASIALATAVYYSAMQSTGFVGWLLLSAGFSVAYLIRWGLMRMLGNIFDSREGVAAYIASGYLYHLVLTMAVTPLLLLLVYLPWGSNSVWYIIIGLVVLCFIMRVVRGINIFLTLSKGSSLYLFYYLCIVEIAPVLILLKWLFAQ